MLVFANPARRVLGLLFLTIGVLGSILPILPGIPFLILGARLLGRRDPLVRSLLATLQRLMRRLSRSRLPLARRATRHMAPANQRLIKLMLGS